VLDRKQYKKPPLIEVFCELAFEPIPDVDWDELLMADFYRRLGKERFPRSRSMQQPAGWSTSRTSHRGRHRRFGRLRHRFVSNDGNTTVQVAENLLVLNQIPPYYGWERFEADVQLALSIYLDTWPVDGVRQIALHYIDRIDIPDPTFHLEKYFALFPVIPDELVTCPIGNLAMAFEVCGDSDGDILAVAFRQQPSADPSINSFRLQWDYVATTPLSANVPRIVDWLRVAHAASSRAFRASITERCESLFQ
jgi:uncharacterized protein (TIGR04255 family)